MPSSTVANTSATDPENPVSERVLVPAYPRTLAEMQQSQQRWQNRYHKPAMTALPNSDYAQRVKKSNQPTTLSFADAIERVRSRVVLPAAQPVVCPFSFAEIEQLFMLTAEELCLRQHKPFVIDEYNDYALQNIIGYVAGDTTRTVLCLTKGLYLYGPTGVGKTLLMTIL